MTICILNDPKFRADAKAAFEHSIKKPLQLLPLGNGFVALIGRNEDGVKELSVHSRETGEEFPQVIEAAIGVDMAGTRLNLAHLPKGIDVIARLQKITCFKGEGNPYLGL